MIERIVLCLALFGALLTGCLPASTSGERPPEVKGPAHGFLPVPAGVGNWTASEPTAEATARAFVLGVDGECDCAEVAVQTETERGGEAVVKVVLRGLKDDSLRDMEYHVTLQKVAGGWKVQSATYRVECRRGVTDDGLCV